MREGFRCKDLHSDGRNKNQKQQFEPWLFYCQIVYHPCWVQEAPPSCEELLAVVRCLNLILQKRKIEKEKMQERFSYFKQR